MTDLQEAQANFKQANELYKAKDYQQASDKYQEIISGLLACQGKADEHRILLVECYLNLCSIFFKCNQIHESINTYGSAMSLCQLLGNTRNGFHSDMVFMCQQIEGSLNREIKELASTDKLENGVISNLARNYFLLGELNYYSNKPSQAISSYKRTIDTMNLIENKSDFHYQNMAASYGNIGTIYNELNEYDSAIAVFQQEVEVINKITNMPDIYRQKIVEAKDKLASIYMYLERYNDAMLAYDYLGELYCFLNIESDAMSDRLNKNNYNLIKAKAAFDANIAVNTFKNGEGSSSNIGVQYQVLGNICEQSGNIIQAVQHYLNAIELFESEPAPNVNKIDISYIALEKLLPKEIQRVESINDRSDDQNQTLASYYYELAKAINYIKPSELVAPHYSQAIKTINLIVNKSDRFRRMLARSYFDMGSIYKQYDNPERTLESFKQYLVEVANISRMTIDDNHYSFIANNNIAKIDYELKRYDEAIDHYDKAITIFHSVNYFKSSANIRNPKSKALDHDELIKLSNCCYRNLSLCHATVAENHFKLGNYSEAIISFTAAVEVLSSVSSKNDDDKKKLVENICRIVSANLNLELYIDAIAFYSKACEILRSFNTLAKTKNNYLLATNSYNEVTQSLEQHLKLKLEKLKLINDKDGTQRGHLANVFRAIAEFYFIWTNYDDTINHYQEAVCYEPDLEKKIIYYEGLELAIVKAIQYLKFDPKLAFWYEILGDTYQTIQESGNLINAYAAKAIFINVEGEVNAILAYVQAINSYKALAQNESYNRCCEKLVAALIKEIKRYDSFEARSNEDSFILAKYLKRLGDVYRDLNQHEKAGKFNAIAWSILIELKNNKYGERSTLFAWEFKETKNLSKERREFQSFYETLEAVMPSYQCVGLDEDESQNSATHCFFSVKKESNNEGARIRVPFADL